MHGLAYKWFYTSLPGCGSRWTSCCKVPASTFYYVDSRDTMVLIRNKSRWHGPGMAMGMTSRSHESLPLDVWILASKGRTMIISAMSMTTEPRQSLDGVLCICIGLIWSICQCVGYTLMTFQPHAAPNASGTNTATINAVIGKSFCNANWHRKIRRFYYSYNRHLTVTGGGASAVVASEIPPGLPLTNMD